jgi:hypothetical protein
MKSYVQDLVTVVGGSGKKAATGRLRLTAKGKVNTNRPQIAYESPQTAKNRPLRQKGNGKALGMSKAKEVRPEQVIPFEEETGNF